VWNVLRGGGRESSVKHGAGGGPTGGANMGGEASTGKRGAQAKKDRGRGQHGSRGGTSREGSGGGELDRCIMHQVHTNI